MNTIKYDYTKARNKTRMILKYEKFQYLKLIKYYNKCLCRY